MRRNDWLMAVGVFGAILTVGAIWVLAQYADSQTAPGWVQAIGSLLALFVAIAVAHISNTAQARREHATARQRATNALAILAGDLGELVTRVVILKRSISGYPGYTHLTRLKLDMPPRIESTVHDFTLDPGPLQPVIDVYRAISAYNGYVDVMAQDSQRVENVDRDRRELEITRVMVEQTCREAMDASFAVGRIGPARVK